MNQELLSKFYSHFFEIKVLVLLGAAMVTLLCMLYTVGTDFVYSTLVFFSERMDPRHDVAEVEQQLRSSRLLGLRSFFPRTENNPVGQSSVDPTRDRTYLVASSALWS